MKKNIRIEILAAVLGVSVAAAAQAAEIVRYDIYNGHNKKFGEQIVTHQDDGLIKVHFYISDNGRGPAFDEDFHLGPDGTLEDFHVKGHSELGAPIDEYFARKGGHAEWHSTSEKATGSDNAAGALYVPLNSSFAFNDISHAAIAKRADGRLPLLPSGALTQRTLDEATVTAGGKSMQVKLVAQTGLGLSPNFVWVTTGPKPRLFGFVALGYATLVEQGWEAAADTMIAHQKAAETRLLTELAAQLQHPMQGLTVIRNARVFDSEKAVLTPASDVYVLRGRITAVLPAGSPVRGADSEIDAAGRVLLPGLFDMHSHFSRWDGALDLATGVTTIRDMGNDNTQIQLIIDEVADGKLLAPRLWPAGFLEGESPFSASGGFLIKDLDGAKNAVDWYAEHGYRQLKIYNSFPKDILRDTVAYAHSRGMRVSGHVPAFLRAQDVVEQGYDEIQHINQLTLNFLVTPTTETRTLERFKLPAEKAGDIDLDSKQVQDFIALLKQKNVAIDPTAGAFDFIKQRDGELSEPFAAVADHMPPDVKRGFYVGGMDIPDDATARRYAKSYARMMEFMVRMYRAGVPLVAGTDNTPTGYALQSELEIYVKSGLTPAQALQIATLNGARYTFTSAERGSIAAGKLADLVLVDGDPTRDIGDLRKVALVITRGYLVYPNEVNRAIGIEPFVLNPPQLRAVGK